MTGSLSILPSSSSGTKASPGAKGFGSLSILTRRMLLRGRQVQWWWIALLVGISVVSLSEPIPASESLEWKATTLDKTNNLEELCVSKSDVEAFRRHSLYQHSEFLEQQPVESPPVQQQYQKAVKFLTDRKLTTVHVYGHRTTDRTHRWIHFAWMRTWLDVLEQAPDATFQVCWTDYVEDGQTLPKSFWENSLVLGTYSQNVMPPVVDSSVYIVHCMDKGFYQDLPANVFQWYREDYETEFGNVWSKHGLFLNWATDLNPAEIEHNRPSSPAKSPPKGILFCGTIWSRNRAEWDTMTRVAKHQKIPLQHYGKGQVSILYRGRLNPYYQHHGGGFIGHREQYLMYSRAYMTPSIQGEKHLDNGYVPCRIFKTISAGQLGISNNKAVGDLFGDSIVLKHGVGFGVLDDLIQEATKILDGTDPQEMQRRINDAMTVVQQQHTYLARFVQAFDYIEKCLEGGQCRKQT